MTVDQYNIIISDTLSVNTSSLSFTLPGYNSPTSRFSMNVATKCAFNLIGVGNGTSSTNTLNYGISFTVSSGTQAGIIFSENYGDGTSIGFFDTNSYAAGPQLRMFIDPAGHMLPGANASYDIGSTTLTWRNIYTSDLNLNNGIGDWTIVEGEEDLFLYNNKKNKVYKFALIEVDPATATKKIT